MTSNQHQIDLEKLASLAKRRGFVFQSSEIYGGLASTWDYGPLGVELKRKIKDLWWNQFVINQENIFGLFHKNMTFLIKNAVFY